VYVYALAPRLQARSGACDPSDPGACEAAGRFSRIVLWCSAILYLLGCFTAYVLGPILMYFDWHRVSRSLRTFITPRAGKQQGKSAGRFSGSINRWAGEAFLWARHIKPVRAPFRDTPSKPTPWRRCGS